MLGAHFLDAALLQALLHGRVGRAVDIPTLFPGLGRRAGHGQSLVQILVTLAKELVLRSDNLGETAALMSWYARENSRESANNSCHDTSCSIPAPVLAEMLANPAAQLRAEGRRSDRVDPIESSDASRLGIELILGVEDGVLGRRWSLGPKREHVLQTERDAAALQ